MNFIQKRDFERHLGNILCRTLIWAKNKKRRKINVLDKLVLGHWFNLAEKSYNFCNHAKITQTVCVLIWMKWKIDLINAYLYFTDQLLFEEILQDCAFYATYPEVSLVCLKSVCVCWGEGY